MKTKEIYTNKKLKIEKITLGNVSKRAKQSVRNVLQEPKVSKSKN